MGQPSGIPNWTLQLFISVFSNAEKCLIVYIKSSSIQWIARPPV
jgi:hypothetical protein